MYELLSYMGLMYAFRDGCTTLEKTGGFSVLEIFGKDDAVMYTSYLFTLNAGTCLQLYYG